jgi:classical protein kinase C
LLDKKYGRAVDWWAFGVLIYQMLLQQSPFRGEDEDEIYDAILADEPLYPIHMPRDSVSILQKLLTREPDQRLGSGPTDAQEIMSQPFFRNINWDDVYHKRIQPPFQPQITSATDTSNFDSEFTSVTPVLTPVQSGTLFAFPPFFCKTLELTHHLKCFRRPCKRNSEDSPTPQTSYEQAVCEHNLRLPYDTPSLDTFRYVFQ